MHQFFCKGYYSTRCCVLFFFYCILFVFSGSCFSVHDDKNSFEASCQNCLNSQDNLPKLDNLEITLDKKDTLLAHQEVSKKRLLVTVFIHGTLLPFPSWASIKHAFSSPREGSCSAYQHYINSLRLKSAVCYQPIGLQGLFAINKKNKKSLSFGAYAAKKIFSQVYSYFLAHRYADYRFYTFGWSGRLSHKHRKKAASNLYFELVRLREFWRIHGYEIDIDLYGHSHGGNVILNLATAESQFSTLKELLRIEHAVLLGTPIQKETACFFSASLFKRIYNFYSRGDAVQIADLFSSKKPKSWRRFDHFTLKKRYSEKSPSHILKQIECTVGKFKPRHIELWFYKGAGNFLYRDYLIIKPYPLLVYMAPVIYYLDEQKELGDNFYWHVHLFGKKLLYSINPQDKKGGLREIFCPREIFTCQLPRVRR